MRRSPGPRHRLSIILEPAPPAVELEQPILPERPRTGFQRSLTLRGELEHVGLATLPLQEGESGV
jgi:hypothetical protein